MLGSFIAHITNPIHILALLPVIKLSEFFRDTILDFIIPMFIVSIELKLIRKFLILKVIYFSKFKNLEKIEIRVILGFIAAEKKHNLVNHKVMQQKFQEKILQKKVLKCLKNKTNTVK